MAGAAKDRDAREARERARTYQARKDYQEGRIRRRSRDNLIAAIAGGAVILGAVLAQTLYFTTGPGAPAPEPTVTEPAPTAPGTESPLPDETGTPAPDVTDEPSPTPSPSATE